MAENNKKYAYRFLARIVIEATTPISVGSGESDVMTDHLVVRDVNELPYIPGTALAGIIRHAIDKTKADSFFGTDGVDGEGSQIIFSSAQLIGKGGKIIEGLLPVEQKDDYLALFDNLPVRQHVRMTGKGTATDQGKFDNEVVYKGTRFCFEIEMLSESMENKALFDECLGQLVSGSFRIGSGTHSGYGECAVVECKKQVLNLSEPADMDKYLEKTSSLNDPFWKGVEDSMKDLKSNDDEWIVYRLNLKPDDFFLFSSGFGNEDADMTPVTEAFITWRDGIPELNNKCVLIPGSSVKGALSHRVAYHYNKLAGIYAGILAKGQTKENIEKEFSKHIGENNNAIKALFGYAIGDKEVKRGNVILSDFIKQELTDDKKKILNHVSIDRFTGGAIDGALFSEEVVYGTDFHPYTLSIIVNNKAFDTDKVKEAFEAALDDITTGMLPLGGGTNRGHGCFSGTWEIIKQKEEVK